MLASGQSKVVTCTIEIKLKVKAASVSGGMMNEDWVMNDTFGYGRKWVKVPSDVAVPTVFLAESSPCPLSLSMSTVYRRWMRNSVRLDVVPLVIRFIRGNACRCSFLTVE